MLKKVIATLVLLCSCVMLVPSIESKAETEMDKGYEFYVNFARPSVSDTQGYINCLRHGADGTYRLVTYYWTISSSSSSSTTPTQMYIDLSSSSIKFNVYANSSTTSVMFSLFEISGTGDNWSKSAVSTSSVTLSFGDLPCVGWQIYGNGTFSSTISNSENFTVYYVDDGTATLLKDVIEILAYSYDISEDIYDTVFSILNSVDGVENQLSSVVSYLKSVDNKLTDIKTELQNIYDRVDELLEEQKKSNTWLEKIFEEISGQAEEEKNVALDQGNSSVNDSSNAIADNSAGFTDSLSTLTGSMAYTGTECSWTFPEVRLPAIAGVMDEVVLIESQPIDFGYWVNQIPSGILLLVQSVLSVALVVYCFKELYSTISYVLTLRGGGADE